MNGKRDGNETDTDCGGIDCPPCTDGLSCNIGADCTKGACVESVCCGSTSCDFCTSCAIPGHRGTCTNLPSGTEDEVNHCLIAAVCDGKGTCGNVMGLKHFGEACTQASDCYNGVCQAGFCKLANGDPCSDDVSCGSQRCAGNVCAGCVDPTDCASGKCDAGVCELLGGAPCAANTDCAGGLCTSHNFCVQSGSEACNPAGCITHACPDNICATCTGASDCPLNTPCTGGTCLAPPGAYCTADSQCASGKCGPAALLTFPQCQ